MGEVSKKGKKEGGLHPWDVGPRADLGFASPQNKEKRGGFLAFGDRSEHFGIPQTLPCAEKSLYKYCTLSSRYFCQITLLKAVI